MPRAMQWFRGKPERPPADLVGAELKDIAKFIQKRLTTKRRDSGESYVSATDDTPQWIVNLFHEAHGDMLPDDYKYEYIQDSIEWIADGNDLESPDIEADVYTEDLIKWLGSHIGTRPNYVDEAVAQFGGHSDQGIVGDIMMGQAMEKDEVYHIVLQGLQKIQEGSA